MDAHVSRVITNSRVRCGAGSVTLLLGLAGAVRAQCPDGTPPPCGAERLAAARRAPPSAQVRTRRFLLLPFRNVTRGEAQAWLEDGAPLMLADGLAQFRELTVVSDERLRAARRRLGIAADAAPDADQVRRIAEETGGWTVVTGSVIATGGRLRMAAQALDAATGGVLVRADAEVVADGDVRPAFDRLTARLLEAAGLPPGSPDLASVTTHSLDAYLAYVRGYRLIQQSAYARARDALREAVRLDSTFAMAWARLALAGASWDVAELLNPLGSSYRAVERAAALSGRLPPRQAAQIRILASLFRGQLAASRALADSLARADPDDLDPRAFLASFEMLDPALDTTVSPPTMRGSFNRAVAYARFVLERDPEQRHIYATLGYVYGTAGGLWLGDVQGVRGERSSFAATLLASTEAYFVPVLRDTFELVPESLFNALPEEERARLRRRSADAGMAWMQRWLAAGPNDADAHLWVSRMAQLQGDWALALRETEAAAALGVESAVEGVSGRRVMLLTRAGRFAEAGALADSLVGAGGLRRPLFAVFDRGWWYTGTALLLTRRFSRASALLVGLTQRPGEDQPPRCFALVDQLEAGRLTSLPRELVRAVVDTMTAHAGAVLSEPELRECLGLAQLRRPGRDDASAQAAVRRLLEAADSLGRAGSAAGAYYAGLAAWRVAPSAVAPQLQGQRGFADVEEALAVGRRFRPVALVVEADSVTLTWERVDRDPLRWDHPDIVSGWTFRVLLPGAPRSGEPQYAVSLRHPWQRRAAPMEGDLSAFAAAMTERGVSVTPQGPTPHQTSWSAVAQGERLRVVIRGDLADELRRLRPATAQFTYYPCAHWEMVGTRGCPASDVAIEVR
jgi:TolB-like protein